MRKHNRKKAFLLILTIILLTGCGRENKTTKAGEPMSDDRLRSVYEIAEYLDDCQYEEYMQSAPDQFNALLDFKKRMEHASAFDFHAFANNFIEVIGKEVPDACLVNHGTEYEADSMYTIDGERINAAEAIRVNPKSLAEKSSGAF